MKYFTLFLLMSALLFRITTIFSQNLVVNGSFEDQSSCPTDYDQLYKAVGWSSIGQSVDLIDSCGIDEFEVLPNTNTEFVSPKYGGAYTGVLISFPYRLRDDTIFREFIQGTFEEPLKKGYYHVSFYINTTEKNRTNHLGIYFSESALDTISSYPKNIEPQYTFNEWIGDYNRWKKHECCINNVDKSTHFILGNFYDPGKDKVEYPDVEFANYIFLDNISMIKIPSFIEYDTIYMDIDDCYTVDSTYEGIALHTFNEGENIGTKFCPQRIGNYDITQRIKSCNKILRRINIQVTDCNCNVYFPNAINLESNLSVNRKLQLGIESDCKVEFTKVELFDRWGNRVYSTNKSLKSVSIDLKHHITNTGVYFYSVEYNCLGNEHIKKSSLMVF